MTLHDDFCTGKYGEVASCRDYDTTQCRRICKFYKINKAREYIERRCEEDIGCKIEDISIGRILNEVRDILR